MPRPRKTLPEGGLATIRELASAGANEVQIAKQLGMSYEVWQRIRTEDEEARSAWLEARAIEREALCGMLYRQAMEEGNATAAMFLLKTRHDYRDHGQSIDGTDAGSRVNIVLNLPAALSREDYGKLIELRPNDPVQERAA